MLLVCVYKLVRGRFSGLIRNCKSAAAPDFKTLDPSQGNRDPELLVLPRRLPFQDAFRRRCYTNVRLGRKGHVLECERGRSISLTMRHRT